VLTLCSVTSGTVAARGCTQDVTNAISTGGSKGLAKYGESCTHELNKIVELVRGTLTKLQRATCSALVVIDVHARDVSLQMAEQRVESVRDFKWESQLRCAPPNLYNAMIVCCDRFPTAEICAAEAAVHIYAALLTRHMTT
jgi:hypothetical protein